MTGYGLLVAIPAVLVFNWLTGRIARYEAGLANAGSELIDQLEAGTLQAESAEWEAPARSAMRAVPAS